ncbi:MAG: hypothetical protein ACYC5G_03880 [Candidatus Doudnabacteria bacterium]
MLRRLSFMEAWVIQLPIQQSGQVVFSKPFIFFPELFNTCILWFGKDKEISSAIISGGRVVQIAKTTLGDELAIKAGCAAEILHELRSSQRFYVRNLLQGHSNSRASGSALGWFVECSDEGGQFDALMVGTKPSYISDARGPDIHSQVLIRWNESSESIIVGRVPRDLTILEYARIPVNLELQYLADSWLRAYDSLQEVRREVDNTMLLVEKGAQVGLQT